MSSVSMHGKTVAPPASSPAGGPCQVCQHRTSVLWTPPGVQVHRTRPVQVGSWSPRRPPRDDGHCPDTGQSGPLGGLLCEPSSDLPPHMAHLLFLQDVGLVQPAELFTSTRCAVGPVVGGAEGQCLCEIPQRCSVGVREETRVVLDARFLAQHSRSVLGGGS